MRGKKGIPHTDPEDPPRRRANKARGHGTWENDRPPVCGVVGREGGKVRLTVAEHADGETLRRVVMRATWPMVSVVTDEGAGTTACPRWGGRTRRSATRPVSGRGTTTGTGSARSTTTRWKGCGPG